MLRVLCRRMELGEPLSYLALSAGVPVYSSDGKQLGEVEHVLCEAEEDIFDGIVFDASPGGHRFVDAPEVHEIFERGVILKLDAAAAERLPEPSANPATMEASPDDATESDVERKLRRAWDLISGNY
jgi:hypothetical protein